MFTKKDLLFIKEASGHGINHQEWSFVMNSEKAHVAFAYNHNSGLCTIMTWDNIDELAADYGTNTDDWLGLADADPMTLCTDGCVVYFKVR